MRPKDALVLAAIIATAVMGTFTHSASSGHMGVGEDRIASTSADDGDGSNSLHLGGPRTTTTTAPGHGHLVLENRHLSEIGGPTLENAGAPERRCELALVTTKEAGPSRFEDFPTMEESTVMFLHVFKCAGSTLRRMMVDWAIEDGKSGAIVVDCDNPKEEGKVCLHDHHLINTAVQEKYIAKQKVLAGHFMWGFQRHVKTPYLMITSLRNPLEAFVSGQQYMHRDETKTLLQATQFVSWIMAKKLGYEVGPTPGAGVNYQALASSRRSRGDAAELPDRNTAGYIRRFIGVTDKHIPEDQMHSCVQAAIANLDTFWIVGLVEQYPGFEEALMRVLDPRGRHKKLWETYTTRRYNTSPVTTPNILSMMDPDMVQEFNASLSLQWKLYDRAVELWHVRCREILPESMHKEKCPVPGAPQGYT